jgi:hypothetical protein
MILSWFCFSECNRAVQVPVAAEAPPETLADLRRIPVKFNNLFTSSTIVTSVHWSENVALQKKYSPQLGARTLAEMSKFGFTPL